MICQGARLRGAFVAAGVTVGSVLLASPAQAATTVTFSGGVLTIVGDAAGNSLFVGRTTAGVITLNGLQVAGGTATTANVRLVRVEGGAGNDALRLDETGGPMPPGEFLGGGDNDTLAGGSAADTLDGGPGADSISGNGGADILTGGAGNEKVVGGPGIDTVSLGEGSDEFTWTPGDGNDLLSPGADKDTLKFDAGTGELVNIVPKGSRAFVLIPSNPGSPQGTPPKVEMDISGFELVKLNLADFILPDGQPAARTVRVNDVPGAGLGVVRVDFAPHTGPGTEFNSIVFRGTLGADRIRIAGSPAVGIDVFGVSQTILAERVNRLTIFGGDGDDVIDASRLAAGTTILTEFGGGNPFNSDHLSDGNDTLIGTPGDDDLFGGTGNNTYDGRGGNDTIRDQ